MATSTWKFIMIGAIILTLLSLSVLETQNQAYDCADHISGNFIEPSECPHGGEELELCKNGQRKKSYCVNDPDEEYCEYCTPAGETYMPNRNNCTVCWDCSKCRDDEEEVTACSPYENSECRCLRVPPVEDPTEETPTSTLSTSCPVCPTCTCTCGVDDLITCPDCPTLPAELVKNSTIAPNCTKRAALTQSDKFDTCMIIVWYGVAVIIVAIFIIIFLCCKGKRPCKGCCHHDKAVTQPQQVETSHQDKPIHVDPSENDPFLPKPNGGFQMDSLKNGANQDGVDPAPPKEQEEKRADNPEEGNSPENSEEKESDKRKPSDHDLETDAERVNGPRKDKRKEEAAEEQKRKESDLDGLDEVEPDDGGRYNQSIKNAWPNREQLKKIFAREQIKDMFSDFHLQEKFEPEIYDMVSSSTKGFAFILNNKSFPSHSKETARVRRGSEVDLANMTHMWEEMGYRVSKYEDLTGEEIEYELKKFSKDCNEARDACLSVVVFLMSHGSDRYVHGTDLKEVELATIEHIFDSKRCSSLKGKPKLFFYSMCRVTGDGKDDLEYDGGGWSHPVEYADTFIAYATKAGTRSLRSKKEGTWFVQGIAEVFFKSAHEDNLGTLMTKVNKHVINLEGKNEGEKVGQTPEYKNRLQKDLFFFPKFPPKDWPGQKQNS